MPSEMEVKLPVKNDMIERILAGKRRNHDKPATLEWMVQGRIYSFYFSL